VLQSDFPPPFFFGTSVGLLPDFNGDLTTHAHKNNQESDFFALLQDYFPILFDIKYIAVTSCENLKGGLNRIAEILEVCNRI